MFVYSEKILQFIRQVKQILREILSKEIGLKVSGNRFFDANKKFSYPLSVVIYNDKSMLGYFDPIFFELGLHEHLMYVQLDKLRSVLRHELAHYMVWIEGEPLSTPHGAPFKSFCKKMGWGEEVLSATMELGDIVSPIEDSSLLRKIKKLMALSTSANPHEAEQAMIKSRKLLLHHNIESSYLGPQDEEKVFLKRVLKQPKKTTKMSAIGKILGAFFVHVVFLRSREGTYLEILGTEVNVDIAEYIAHVLDQTLDALWDQTKSSHHLKGLTAKNSFFLGLAKGYCNKIQALKRLHESKETKALILIEEQLDRAKALVYERLSYTTGYGSYCPTASSLGEKAGRSLNIHPGIHQKKNGHSPSLISHK